MYKCFYNKSFMYILKIGATRIIKITVKSIIKITVYNIGMKMF